MTQTLHRMMFLTKRLSYCCPQLPDSNLMAYNCLQALGSLTFCPT